MKNRTFVKMMTLLSPADSHRKYVKTAIALEYNELETTPFAGIVRYLIEKTLPYYAKIHILDKA